MLCSLRSPTPPAVATGMEVGEAQMQTPLWTMAASHQAITSTLHTCERPSSNHVSTMHGTKCLWICMHERMSCLTCGNVTGAVQFRHRLISANCFAGRISPARPVAGAQPAGGSLPVSTDLQLSMAMTTSAHPPGRFHMHAQCPGDGIAPGRTDMLPAAAMLTGCVIDF